MDKNMIMGETLFPDCPVRNILSRVGDKWSLLLMHQLMHHPAPMRFSDLRKAIPDISQKVLTTTLRNLEADGFLVRKVYAEVPPRPTTPSLPAPIRSWMPAVQWCSGPSTISLTLSRTGRGIHKA